METPRRNGSYDAEAILRVQLDLAKVMVENFAKSARPYQLMWGPLGGPAIEVMERALKV